MAWANWEATAATVAANAATAKHFDTNVGSPRWQQMEGRQKGGRGWRTYFTSAGDHKNANAQAKEGKVEGSEEWGPTWQANYKCNHEINLINPGTKNAEQMFVETALRH